MAPLIIKKIKTNRPSWFLTLWYKIKNLFLPSNELIRRNRKFLEVKNSEVLRKRQDYKIDIENHILYRDRTGKTLGCGCIHCQLRHSEYKSQQELNRLTRDIIKYNNLNIRVNNTIRYIEVENTEKKSIRIDPSPHITIIDPFAEELITRLPMGKYRLKDHEVYNKQIKRLTIRKTNIEQKYNRYKTGRQSIARITLIPG